MKDNLTFGYTQISPMERLCGRMILSLQAIPGWIAIWGSHSAWGKLLRIRQGLTALREGPMVPWHDGGLGPTAPKQASDLPDICHKML